MKTIYSIGHSNKSEEELVAKLQKHGITDLIDVRTYPSSKYNPQFNRVQLERYIPQGGMKYHWRGKNIGGLAGNSRFEETIEKILGAVKDDRKICLMCSESKPHECHRTQTIEPVVEKLGGKMVHILWTEIDGSDIMGEQAVVQTLFGEEEKPRRRNSRSAFSDSY